MLRMLGITIRNVSSKTCILSDQKCLKIAACNFKCNAFNKLRLQTTTQPLRSSTRRAFSINASSSSFSNDATSSRRVSHILLSPGQEELLEDLKSQIEADPTRFETLAREYSNCPSKAQGGDIGWISKGRTVAEFEAAAYSIKDAEDIATCITKFGFHLIKVTGERTMVAVGHCSVQELAEILASGQADPSLLDNLQFVDVREPWEVDIASIPAFTKNVLPLSQFQEWGSQISTILNPAKETYVLCHHGVRSMQAANFLVESGFKNVKNVSGGIDAYTRGIDENIPLY